ncbi:MAG: hypothetical protein V4454_00710 [Pseudomonadota bacterium]
MPKKDKNQLKVKLQLNFWLVFRVLDTPQAQMLTCDSTFGIFEADFHHQNCFQANRYGREQLLFL